MIEPRQDRSRRTRKAILDAGRRQFVERGVEATSVDAVCAEAGVAKGAFYHHFPSKNALVRELVMVGGERLRDELLELVSSDLTTTEVVERALRALAERLARTPTPLLREAADRLLERPGLDDERRAGLRGAVRVLVMRAEARGELDPTWDPDDAVVAITGCVLVTVLDWIAEGAPPTPPLGDVMVRRVGRLLAPSSPSRARPGDP